MKDFMRIREAGLRHEHENTVSEIVFQPMVRMQHTGEKAFRLDAGSTEIY